MARKTEVTESNKTKDKMLVKIGEHRKSWLEAIAGIAEDGSVTETMKCIIDLHIAEDPESFAGRIVKWRTKAALEEIEREKAALQAREDAILKGLGSKGELVPAEER